MLASLLYVPEIKREKNREKKHYFLSIQCWVPSHITIQHVCTIKNGAQCWVCMTNTDTKILEFRLQCSMYKNKQITYRNAYSFITYHVMHICLVMLILNLLANFYTAALKTSHCLQESNFFILITCGFFLTKTVISGVWWLPVILSQVLYKGFCTLNASFLFNPTHSIYYFTYMYMK